MQVTGHSWSVGSTGVVMNASEAVVRDHGLEVSLNRQLKVAKRL